MTKVVYRITIQIYCLSDFEAGILCITSEHTNTEESKETFQCVSTLHFLWHTFMANQSGCMLIFYMRLNHMKLPKLDHLCSPQWPFSIVHLNICTKSFCFYAPIQNVFSPLLPPSHSLVSYSILHLSKIISTFSDWTQISFLSLSHPSTSLMRR